MKLLRVYFETSIFGFYYDALPHNAHKQTATQQLFQQLKTENITGLVSGLVLQELEQLPPPYQKQLLELLKQFPFTRLVYDESEAERLAQLYVREKIIPADVPQDALHAAIATLAEVDVLVTWNCKHLANEFRARQIKALNLKEGYGKEFSIRTPEEVILYAD